jgi:hypothetical protein
MQFARQTILALHAIAYTFLWYCPLHAEEQLARPQMAGAQDKVLSLLLDADAKQCCATCPTWCPDDYRPKCPPPTCPPRYCGGCDGYDVKCPPCICPPRYCGNCDWYDAKCAPCVKTSWRFPSFYRCPPAAWYERTVGKISSWK